MSSILTDPSVPAVREALEQHEREISATYARVLGGDVQDRPDMLLYITGLPAPFANGVKAPRLEEALAEGKIKAVLALLRSAGVPGTWSVGPLATPRDLGERLERAGFRRDHDLPWLASDIGRLDLYGKDAPDLVIRRVGDDEDHQRWLRVMEAGFGMPADITRTIDVTARAVGFDPAAQWVRFVGLVDESPVASSGLVLSGGVAGIYNVATLPDHRRRGFGASLTRAAIRYATDAGYQVAALATSELARGVYERLGFRDVCVVRQYVFEPQQA